MPDGAWNGMPVYCQRVIGEGPKFCPRKAIGPDPNNPKSSVCREHLDEQENR